ncbi:MAG: mechanosensitive ion channel family protein, partial [Oscillospiraceae bacterium]|nr:mechanosensitive ion channel family protein [Oscillospiraceae bacterium]
MDISSLLSDSGVSLGTLTLASAVKALCVLVVGIILIKVLLTLIDKGFDHSEKLSPLKKHIRPVIKTVLGVVLALVVLDSLGVEVTSFIALISVAGLAVSLALQNTLANIAGGIMILTTQPYSLGDYVSVSGMEGTVDLIRLSSTKLVTVDNKQIIIPNSTVAGATVTNFNRLGRRRVDLTFTASYDSATEDVYAALNDAMSRFPQITGGTEVHLSEYGPSSISYIARMWVAAGDYWTVYWGMLEAVRETFA